MRARSVALALIGGPVVSHLFIAGLIGRIDPSEWGPDIKALMIVSAVVIALAIALLSEELADAGY